MTKNHILSTLILLILNFTTSSAQSTYTWIGSGGIGGSGTWNTTTHWSPNRTTPNTSDILQFNLGGAPTITVSSGFTDGSISISGNTSVTLSATATRSMTITNVSGDDLVITAGSGLTIGSNINITLASNATANIAGTITINSSRTYNTNGTSVVTTVTGSVINAGTITSTTASKLLFNGGSTYQHNQQMGTIPIATWNANSTCQILQWGSSNTDDITNLNQNYGNLTINYTETGTTGFAMLPTGGTFSIQGNFTMNTSSGARPLRLSRSTTVASTFNVGGNFIMTLGAFQLKDEAPSANLNISGNYTQTGGTFYQRTNSTSNTSTVTVNSNFGIGTGTYNLSDVGAIGTLNVAGNFSHTGGTITETSSGSGSIIFNGSGTQTYTSGGTVSNTINFTVNSGSTLQMAASGTVVSGAGTFTLSSGGSLGITSAAGITTVGTATGNIQTTGGRSYSTGANYIYNGTSGQSTGTGFPTNLTGSLTINNSGNTVTLSNARTISNGGLINLNAGTFAAGTNLTMASTSLINRSEGSMTGTLQGTGTYNVNYTGNSKTTGGELGGSGLNNVTVNLSAGQTLTLDQSRTVASTLIMTDGNIVTGANTLSLGTSTSNLGTLTRTSGTIIGNFRRWFASGTVNNVLFPVGTSGNFRPFNISFTGAITTGGTLTVSFVATDPGSSGLPLDDSGITIVNVGNAGYWTAVSGDGLAGGTYSLDLTADGFPGVSVVSSLRILKRPTGGGSWSLQGTHLTGTGTTTTPVARRTGLTGFSEFGIGGASDNPLPVELSLFTAKVVEGIGVVLKWRTETEVNNYGFEILRSKQGENNWTKLGFEPGHGNSNSPKEYSFTDNVTIGKFSYRLKQIDTDGQYEYSKIIDVDAGKFPDEIVLEQNYPNPFNPYTTINFIIPGSGQTKLSVFNLLGEEIATLIEEYREAGVYTINFNAENLDSGVYIYRLESGNFVKSRKMILIK